MCAATLHPSAVARARQALFSIAFSIGLSVQLRAAPADLLRFERLTPTQTALSSVAFGNGRFVAVSGSSPLLISTDGLRWTSQALPSGIAMTRVIYGDRFVGVGAPGLIASSTDGLVWTRGSVTGLSNAVAFKDVAYGKGLYVAVASVGGKALISTNGTAWTAVPGPTATSIAYGNGRFVAVTNSQGWVSEDAVTWTPTPIGSSKVVFGNGLFVAVSPFRTSFDGVHWQTQTLNTGLSSFDFVGGKFVGFSSYQVLISADAKVWTTINLGVEVDSGFRGAGTAYGNGRYVAVGGRNIFTSVDAINWEFAGMAGSLGAGVRVLGFAEDQFVGVQNYYRAPIWLSPDGFVWHSSALTSELLRTSLSPLGITAGNGKLVLVGGSKGSTFAVMETNGDWTAGSLSLSINAVTFGQGTFVAVGEQGLTATSTDGVVWTVTPAVTTNRLTAVTAGPDQFVAVGDLGGVLVSPDAFHWVARQASRPIGLLSIASGAGLYVACGAGGAIELSRDGINWRSQVSRTSSTLRSVAYGNELFVAVGDAGTYLISGDGTNWTRRILTGSSQEALASVTYGKGKFLASTPTSLWMADLNPGLMDTPKWQDGAFGFAVVGVIGQAYQVQASDALGMGWMTLGAVTNNHVSVSFVDPGPAGQRQRFYRVTSAP